ncbi:energy-coupled thiamine transporter ThiT [Spiroplasma endosymbiont of Virgichneumon dumeticola]|uniref:energy-coupled thiamine transporter ThiT n=1 Tax=Spiroplasma endosymbiont of Virgichneumon dumeticola TaxID=3139323 RepID=UPI0035C8F004
MLLTKIKKEPEILKINHDKIKKDMMVNMLFKISTLISLVFLLSILILVSVLSASRINNFFHINPDIGYKFYSSKVCLIIVSVLLLTSAVLVAIISWTANIDKIHENIFVFSFLAICSINVIVLILNLIKHYQWQKTQGFALLRTQWSKKIKAALGIKKWVTVDYVMIAIFSALTIVCAFIEENLLPHLPYGGGIAIKYIPLMVISFSVSFAAGWLTGMISALMSLLFIPAGNIISPWSYLLDYFLPMTTPAIIALLRFNLKADKSLFTYINYWFHCFIVCLIIYMWQTMSGYFVWIKLFGAKPWNGFNPIFYSLVYNFIHIFLFTYLVMQLTVPFIYRGLVSHYVERYR